MQQIGLLSAVIWLPIAGGLVTLAFGEQRARAARWAALVAALLTLALCIQLYAGFANGTANFQFIERLPWIPALKSQYYLGVDGISLPLILLTAFMTVPVIIAGWSVVDKRPAQYYAAFLIMEGLMIGVFSALDSLMFFLYTFLGSVLMLVALIYLYLKAGDYSIAAMQKLPLTLPEQRWIFLAFLLAFAVKVPMWPVHTWLPDAHVEAPTGGSVILAAIMLKMGGYGLLRFSLPMTPDASHELDWLIIALSLIAIVYIAFVALVQQDMKKLIAYSSIAHMGFVTLGAFLAFYIMAATGSTRGAVNGLDGALVQMISQGLISGALFLCIGVMYDRLHTREISAYGGVINVMPKFGAFMVLFALANSGVPGTSGFIGEFLVILASFKASFWFALTAGTILILGAAYNLWLVKRVIFGPVANEQVAGMQDLNAREFLVLGVLALAVVLLGVWPAPMLNMMEASIQHLLLQILTSKIPGAA